ncbi:hypothetical protein K6M90_28270 [Rhizobium sp. 9T]|uniref:Uncharacterized protein n=1 Tax=Rhizobium croatiense TaxID=2867516 RepID=A0ABS7M6J1_9HYPH|nr:hypothetical protein [Rhizobium croatiense]MBY4611530.1 hypothetical protein [Rhizobium croatiense]MBY4632747.1 hypothetical protein [Rhizobium croatiense]
MGEIRYRPNRGLLKDQVIQRIVAAAKANAGLWLMIKERAVEKRAIKAELERLGADAKDVDRRFPTALTPTIAELADELVSSMFGNCPPEIGSRVQSALLKAAESELDGSPQP